VRVATSSEGWSWTTHRCRISAAAPSMIRAGRAAPSPSDSWIAVHFQRGSIWTHAVQNTRLPAATISAGSTGGLGAAFATARPSRARSSSLQFTAVTSPRAGRAWSASRKTRRRGGVRPAGRSGQGAPRAQCARRGHPGRGRPARVLVKNDDKCLLMPPPTRRGVPNSGGRRDAVNVTAPFLLKGDLATARGPNRGYGSIVNIGSING